MDAAFPLWHSVQVWCFATMFLAVSGAPQLVNSYVVWKSEVSSAQDAYTAAVIWGHCRRPSSQKDFNSLYNLHFSMKFGSTLIILPRDASSQPSNVIIGNF